MQQSISILVLPMAELSQAIEQELQDNPLLEMEDGPSDLPQNSTDAEILKKVERHRELARMRRQEALNDDEATEEKPITKELSLEDCLLEQLRFEFNEPLQLKIGELIIGNLDEDGYLKLSCEEIAQTLSTHHIHLVEHVLHVVQNFEPIGIACRNLQECLSIQLEAKYNGQSTVALRIVAEFLQDLGKKRYAEIAKKLGTNVESVKEAAQKIASLEPKPARNYRPINVNIFLRPDVVIRKDPIAGYQVSVSYDGLPRLHVNPLYERMLRDKKLSPEERDFIKDKLTKAVNFIRSVEQRGKTLQDIARYILERQKDFFEGAHLAIVPMTLKDVANSIGRNESTISRAIQDKYVDTPQGLVPMRFFFSQGLTSDNNIQISSRSIKEEIKDLIDGEDKASPLSDQELQEHFKNKGMNVARRTVSKYRQQLNILPSHLRKA